MKKAVKLLSLITAILLICVSSVACNGDSPTQEKIDTKKTQLYVYTYDGGYGSDWLNNVKARFEEKYKEISLEEGKTGVQVKVDPSKTPVTADSIKHDKYQVYFIEGNESAHVLRNKGCFEDLTSVVSSVSPYDNKKIEDKLTDDQKAYWGVQEGGSTHYYCLPHYEGYYGIVYNIDLFDQKGFYFAKDTASANEYDGHYFILPGDNGNKAEGPDGLLNTADDGLPATYDDFYALCSYIKSQSIVPLIWTGEFYSQYVTSLTHALVADAEGSEQIMLNYNFNGEAKDLGTIVQGEFVKDAQPTTITGLNGYELARQQGKYEGISFTEKITKTADFHNEEAFSTLDQLAAQERFLKASWQSGDGINDPCAMLVDGVWWENEASTTFNTMVQGWGSDASKMNRNFGWMYLPKANTDKVGTENVLCDVMYSKCFVRSGLNEVDKALALDFVQFANSDESLREFTVSTGAPKAFQYTLTNSDLAKLSPYAKSLYEYRQNAKIVYPVCQNALYVNNSSRFDRIDGLYNSSVGTNSFATPVRGFHEKSANAADYFMGIYKVFKELSIWRAI